MFDETTGQDFLSDYLARISREEDEAAKAKYLTPKPSEIKVDPSYARARDIMNQGANIARDIMNQGANIDSVTSQPLSPLHDHPDMPPGEDDGRYDSLTGMRY